MRFFDVTNKNFLVKSILLVGFLKPIMMCFR